MKGRIVQTDTKNKSIGQTHSSTGYKRFVPLREFTHKDAQGTPQGDPVWHDFHANKTYAAGENWEHGPPALPSGDVGREPRCAPPSRAYREKYARIFGHD